MNKAETLSALKGATSPEQIDVELLKNYCYHFSNIHKDDREAIFDSYTREIIGQALKREWDKVTSLLERGYNNIETPTGHKIFRNRNSKLYLKYKALIPDDMPVQRCKEIFQDNAGTWQGGVLKKTAMDKLQQSNEDDLEF